MIKTVTIFEGPDGSGKTTAAMAYVNKIGGRYVHCGPFPSVRTGLPRLYVEVMLPALLGYDHVVMDRSWLSEPIYGRAFRGGQNRVRVPEQRMLERVAWRCSPVVVNCEVDLATATKAFKSRLNQEMLDTTAQLAEVHAAYEDLKTSLNMVSFDYRHDSPDDLDASLLMMRPRKARGEAFGNPSAKVLLVGERFSNHQNDDPLLQAPFVSFSSVGCSRWLATLLEAAGIGEDRLMWTNADSLMAFNEESPLPQHIIALGTVAHDELSKLNLEHAYFAHPQGWKRFHAREPYPFIEYLKELLP